MKKLLTILVLVFSVGLLITADFRGFGYIPEGNPIDTYVLKPIDEYVTEPVKDFTEDMLNKIYEMK